MTEAVVDEVAEETIEEQATSIVRRHTAYAAGTAMIPVPLADMVATTGVQVKMVRDLSKLYGVEFTAHAVKGLISALVGTLGAQYAAVGTTSLVKLVPVVGQLASIAVAPGLSGAITYAIGKVFSRHFEMGGTLLTFDVDKMREYFKEEVEKGKSVASQPKANTSQPKAKS